VSDRLLLDFDAFSSNTDNAAISTAVQRTTTRGWCASHVVRGSSGR